MANTVKESQVPDLGAEFEAKKMRKKDKKKRKREREQKTEEAAAKMKVVEEEIKEERIVAKIELMHEVDGKPLPVVGYFPSGYDPTNRPQPSVKLYRSQLKPRRMQVVVTPPDANLDFVGTNYSGEALAPQYCSYALGVFDKEEKTLKIMPIAGNKVFRLEPKFRNPEFRDDEHAKETVDETITELSKQDKMLKKVELDLIYGPKRAKQKAKKMIELIKEKEEGYHKDVAERVKRQKKTTLEDTSAHVSSRNIPPYNSAAATPQEAYPLDKIILKADWDYLAETNWEELEKSTGSKATQNSEATYPIFVKNRIYRLKEIQDDAEKKKLSCIFSFIHHLISYKDVHSIDGYNSPFKNNSSKHIPSSLFHRFQSMFPPDGKNRIQGESRDLLIGYVLVLTLYADEFKTDVEDIARDLRMSPHALRLNVKNLGCNYVLDRVNKKYHATLEAPLEFPQDGRKKRQKRKQY